MIEIAARSSPSTSPMKLCPERDKEIEGFRHQFSNDDYDNSDLEEVTLDERMVVYELY
jgi:hypothetical protein